MNTAPKHDTSPAAGTKRALPLPTLPPRPRTPLPRPNLSFGRLAPPPPATARPAPVVKRKPPPARRAPVVEREPAAAAAESKSSLFPTSFSLPPGTEQLDGSVRRSQRASAIVVGALVGVLAAGFLYVTVGAAYDEPARAASFANESLAVLGPQLAPALTAQTLRTPGIIHLPAVDIYLDDGHDDAPVDPTGNGPSSDNTQRNAKKAAKTTQHAPQPVDAQALDAGVVALEFDRDAASSALSSAAVSSACAGDGTSTRARVGVTFAPNGRATHAVAFGLHAGTEAGGCLARALQGVAIAPFGGEHTTVMLTVPLR